MKGDYKIVGKSVKFETQIEEEVFQVLKQMSEFSKHSISELTNTALKRFIASHKDFLPPSDRDKVFR